MSAPIRILIADDHLIVREGLRLILETADDMRLIGQAADGAEAIRRAEELKPDVVLMDLRMPGVDGLAAIRALHAELPRIGIVILTTYNEDDLLVEGLRAGASAFLLKDTDRRTLLETIRATAAGRSLLQPEVMSRLLAHAGPASRSAGQPSLTAREREVLSAAACGERSKEIAHRLRISERTVKAHLTAVYGKLGVDSRAGAVAAAMQRGLLAAPRAPGTGSTGT